MDVSKKILGKFLRKSSSRVILERVSNSTISLSFSDEQNEILEAFGFKDDGWG